MELLVAGGVAVTVIGFALSIDSLWQWKNRGVRQCDVGDLARDLGCGWPCMRYDPCSDTDWPLTCGRPRAVSIVVG